MSQKKRCDICGKIEDSMATVFKWTEVHAPDLNWKDICPDCSRELMGWIEGRRKARGVAP
jgi:hypothetical protein